jgi:C-terminal processing protease CtpA/Prc
VNPVTYANWEGVGVKPDITVDPEQAVQRAHATALEALLETAPNHPMTEERKKALQSAKASQKMRG